MLYLFHSIRGIKIDNLHSWIVRLFFVCHCTSYQSIFFSRRLGNRPRRFQSQKFLTVLLCGRFRSRLTVVVHFENGTASRLSGCAHGARPSCTVSRIGDRLRRPRRPESKGGNARPSLRGFNVAWQSSQDRECRNAIVGLPVPIVHRGWFRNEKWFCNLPRRAEPGGTIVEGVRSTFDKTRSMQSKSGAAVVGSLRAFCSNGGSRRPSLGIGTAPIAKERGREPVWQPGIADNRSATSAIGSRQLHRFSDTSQSSDTPAQICFFILFIIFHLFILFPYLFIYLFIIIFMLLLNLLSCMQTLFYAEEMVMRGLALNYFLLVHFVERETGQRSEIGTNSLSGCIGILGTYDCPRN